MHPELKQAEKEQFELWKKFNYWQSICASKKATQKDYTVRATVLKNWQEATDRVSALKND